MPFNFPGILAPIHLLINPRLVVPSIVVKGLCLAINVHYCSSVVRLIATETAVSSSSCGEGSAPTLMEELVA